MTTTARFLGTTDDVTTCDCCGRTGLKSTVALLLGESNEPVYYGVTCAAHALRRTAKEVKREARDADQANRAREQAARNAAHAARYAADQAVLDARYPHLAGKRFEQVQALYADGLTLAALEGK